MERSHPLDWTLIRAAIIVDEPFVNGPQLSVDSIHSMKIRTTELAKALVDHARFAHFEIAFQELEV